MEPPIETALRYPDGNPKTILGIAKPAMSSVPPIPMFTMGQAMRDGNAKYGRMNWRDEGVTASIYYDAALRHMMAWYDGEDIAEDSGVHHLGHAMACLAIILDAEAHESLTDDRPTAGKLSEWLKAHTNK